MTTQTEVKFDDVTVVQDGLNVNLEVNEDTESIEQVLQDYFGFEVDKDGFVMYQGEVVEDGTGSGIQKDNIGGFVPLSEVDLGVNEDGIVVDSEGEPIKYIPDNNPEAVDSVVPVSMEDGVVVGILRNSMFDVMNYREAIGKI